MAPLVHEAEEFVEGARSISEGAFALPLIRVDDDEHLVDAVLC